MGLKSMKSGSSSMAWPPTEFHKNLMNGLQVIKGTDTDMQTGR
jgi:hypothetical protein